MRMGPFNVVRAKCLRYAEDPEIANTGLAVGVGFQEAPTVSADGGQT